MAVSVHLFVFRNVMPSVMVDVYHIGQEFASHFTVLFVNIVGINGVISQTKVIFRDICVYS